MCTPFRQLVWLAMLLLHYELAAAYSTSRPAFSFVQLYRMDRPRSRRYLVDGSHGGNKNNDIGSGNSAGAMKMGNAKSSNMEVAASADGAAAVVAADMNVVDTASQDATESCPRGYYLNSVKEQCSPLGPLGRVSQRIELSSWFCLRTMSKRISNLFGIDTARISGLGVGFALSYAILSTINGAISLSLAWYLSCQRTGLSPLAPGQWKSLAAAYGTIYAIIQLLRPFRVAAAIAMSKLSKEFLELTEERLQCPRGVAIAFQYGLGWIAWGACSIIGISLASLSTGVPIWT